MFVHPIGSFYQEGFGQADGTPNIAEVYVSEVIGRGQLPKYRGPVNCQPPDAVPSDVSVRSRCVTML